MSNPATIHVQIFDVNPGDVSTILFCPLPPDTVIQANTALLEKESIVQAEAAEGDATMSGPRAMIEDEVCASAQPWLAMGAIFRTMSTP